MNIVKALVPLALLTIPLAAPVFAAKEAKVPRCNGQSKRPANPYGTILPTLPARGAAAPTPAIPPTQFFPSPSSPQSDGPAAKVDRVPPISEATPPPAPGATSRAVYASC
ncbi:hypothetical protein VVT58_22670 (plasmid) [Sphingobium sp. SJ10-10]|uniref:Uncharacterized protein n=1 Tax=Sphingomonas sp. NS2 TaxID=908605 RepID=A0A0D4ZZE3_9SPHN|nr:MULTISPECIES: hypothetical protein [unclassified Sphingobium]AJW29410.1 hypothetical protein plasmid201_222 [Sphingomonas sp. NS2]AMK26610.1 hypothetical protein K426_28575 [Sphingobium sp. TKS]MEC6699629.1 hypothetical protein [Sphingobium sp. SJ10-10]